MNKDIYSFCKYSRKFVLAFKQICFEFDFTNN